MTQLTLRQRYAIREKHLDACRSLAIKIMDSHPLGLEAIKGGYYTPMFRWLYGELLNGRQPTGVPARLLEEWKRVGGIKKVG